MATYFGLKHVVRKLSKNSIFYDEFEMEMCSLFPKAALDLAIAEFKPSSVVDVGCGTGQSLDYFLNCGLDAIGIEGSSLAIKKAKRSDKILCRDLRKPVELDRRFDLLWSYEVFEHIHPDHMDSLLDSVIALSDNAIVSAAPPGQGGEGHFNEQPPEYWKAQFARRGFVCDEDLSDRFRSLGSDCSNTLVFKHK